MARLPRSPILCSLVLGASCRIASLSYCDAAFLSIRARRPALQSNIEESKLASAKKKTLVFQQPINSSSVSAVSSKSKSASKDNLAKSLLRNLFKGITLPFPSLRKIVLDSEKKKNMQVGLGLRESIAAVMTYLAIGVGSYHYVLEPSWSFVDAMYFTVTCFTTVGYGDLVPTNLASKVFTSMFGLVGISFLGAAIAAVAGSIVDSEAHALHIAKEASRQQLKGIFEDMPDLLKSFKRTSRDQQEAHFAEARSLSSATSVDSGRSVLQRCWRSVLSTFPSLFIIFAGGTIVYNLNGGNGPWWDAIYFSIISASTVGLGDISPITRRARIASIIYIPVAVAAAGDLLSGVASAMMERRQKEVFRAQIKDSLTLKKFTKMDSDKSGRVTRAEYLKFMLAEMGLVDEDELNELDKQFDRLDKTCSGYLDKNDLSLMAKYRGVEVLQ